MPEVEKQVEKPVPLTSVDEILKAVRQKEINYASHFWVPSLKKEVRFKEINTSQQKRLAKSIIDSPVFNTEFIFTFFDILTENCVDDIDIEQLTIIDKVFIALGLRISCIGDTVDIELVPEEGADEIPVSIDLRQIYDIAKDTLTNIEDGIIESDIYEVHVGVPTLKTEFLLEKEMRNHVEDIEINSNSELRETIGTAFIGEVVKYIKGVSLKTDDGLREMTWDNFSFADRIMIIERFGSKLLKKVLKYTNSVKAETEKVELVNFKYNDKDYDRRLTIDGSFFIVS